MKRVQQFVLILIACLFIGFIAPNIGFAKSGTNGQFPENTIVVPMGTSISINDDEGTVTIHGMNLESRHYDGLEMKDLDYILT